MMHEQYMYSIYNFGNFDDDFWIDYDLSSSKITPFFSSFFSNGKLQKNEKAFVPGCMCFVYLSEYALLKLLHAFFKSRRQSFSRSAFPTS